MVSVTSNLRVRVEARRNEEREGRKAASLLPTLVWVLLLVLLVLVLARGRPGVAIVGRVGMGEEGGGREEGGGGGDRGGGGGGGRGGRMAVV